MKREVGEGKELKVEYLLVDLALFSSVKDFVKTFREKNLPLHILIHNAALAWVPFSKWKFQHQLAQVRLTMHQPVIIVSKVVGFRMPPV